MQRKLSEVYNTIVTSTVITDLAGFRQFLNYRKICKLLDHQIINTYILMTK